MRQPCPLGRPGHKLLKARLPSPEVTAVCSGSGAQAVPPKRHGNRPAQAWSPCEAGGSGHCPYLCFEPSVLLWGQASGPHSLGGVRPGGGSLEPLP